MNTKKMTTAAFFMALGVLLPFVTGQIPAIGNMLLPMHVPVLLCGYVCGWQYGLVVGALLPLFRSMFFGMPVLFPTACAMAVELAVYGFCTGVFSKKLGRSWEALYLSLIGAMLCGRAAWGITALAFNRMAGAAFTWQVFFAQAFAKAVPGIIIQLALIPAIVKRIPLENQGDLKKSCIKRFSPVTEAIRKLANEEQEKPILVSIDGKCASGKTTLGYYLKKEFDANLFHMDDFFLQAYQRTGERLAEAGGNVDYERFKKEVLEPVKKGQTVSYQRFDCSTMKLGETETIPPRHINIIEGSYSEHPFFGDCYDLKVFMEISQEDQIENIRRRNGEDKLRVFMERWIPMEEAYFNAFGIKEKSDFVIEWKKPGNLK